MAFTAECMLPPPIVRLDFVGFRVEPMHFGCV